MYNGKQVTAIVVVFSLIAGAAGFAFHGLLDRMGEETYTVMSVPVSEYDEDGWYDEFDIFGPDIIPPVIPNTPDFLNPKKEPKPVRPLPHLPNAYDPFHSLREEIDRRLEAIDEVIFLQEMEKVYRSIDPDSKEQLKFFEKWFKREYMLMKLKRKPKVLAWFPLRNMR